MYQSVKAASTNRFQANLWRVFFMSPHALPQCFLLMEANGMSDGFAIFLKDTTKISTQLRPRVYTRSGDSGPCVTSAHRLFWYIKFYWNKRKVSTQDPVQGTPFQKDGFTYTMGKEICNTADALHNTSLFRNMTLCLFDVAFSINK